MTIHVECPICRKELLLATQEVRRGLQLSCSHCAGEITVSGRFLSDIFWAANNFANNAQVSGNLPTNGR